MSFLDRLYAAERALVDRAAGRVREQLAPAPQQPAYRLVPIRPRGPIGKYWPPNYRQPIVPTTQPGNYRRYEFFASPVSAGNRPMVSVPVGTIWRIITVKTVFTADVTAGNRSVGLCILPDSGSIFQNALTSVAQSSLLVRPSDATHHTWMNGGGTGSFVTQATSFSLWGTGPLPERLILTENARLQFLSDPTNAGDLYSFVEVHVEEWVTVTK